jgi:hypothetical protein
MFKRNQVEEAIAGVLEGSATLSLEVRTRLKRLLDTDRGLGRSKRSVDPERANFAFYSVDSAGRGVEVWFSNYEAFALLVGLQLMQHGWPQGFAVGVLRRVRPDLERQHARILTLNPADLFNQRLILERAQLGESAVGSTDPVFLVIQSHEDHSGPSSSALCCGQEELMPLIRAKVGLTSTIFELTKPIHALSYALAKTRPRKRGRGSE